ncbi:MAG: hypothetical protein ACRD6W_02805 [Nitrososphaerales archaeon]
MSDPYEDVRVPDDERKALIRSVFEPSSLEDVVKAGSVATEFERQLYVERFGDRWRWSLAHAGSGYPLLRISARFLQMDYTALQIGFRTLDNGISILCRDPEHSEIPDASAVLNFDGPTSPEAVADRMRAALTGPR